ncbi:cell division protein FtsQ/DivIB [Litchfieldia salsa]|uniref:cell division protein FtsQ/DivIB n=1 Tax=Litchfieldia salsa TaxID=930152 RepID=UPI000B866E51|nr:FtsQ-type POTRA domain-containing protein [Litchfieldia salsa]
MVDKVVTIEDRIPKLKQKRKQKANRRITITIICFFFMVITVVYLQSPLSKVSSITINGNQHVSDENLIKLSGLSDRTSFWKINKNDVVANLVQHEEIRSAVAKRKLPNHVVIEVEELRRVAYVSDEGQVYPVLENGKTLKALDDTGQAVDAPFLVNWNDGDIVELATELKKLPLGIANSISEIHHTPDDSDRLHITLFMNNGYEVSVTLRGFAEKMLAYPTVIRELDPTLKGVIHLDVVPFFREYKLSDEGGESE